MISEGTTSVQVEIYSEKGRGGGGGVREGAYPKQTQAALRNKISIVWLHFARRERAEVSEPRKKAKNSQPALKI